MSQKTALQHYHSYSKSGLREGILPSQERTVEALLEQAFRIKEDITASLHSTQNSVQAEALSRRLLESHIQTITHIVKQLSKSIEVLEGQIIQRDSVSSGVGFALQSLDHKNQAGIGDLRGRVARCDASIAKLCGDVSVGNREIHKLQQEITAMRANLELRLKDMEIKWSQAERRLDVVVTEHSGSLRDMQGELRRDIQLLELRTSSGLKQLRDDIDRLKEWTELQLRISADTHTQATGQLRSLLQDKMKEMENSVQAVLGPLSVRVERAEQRTQMERRAARERRSEDKLSVTVSALKKSVQEELEMIKAEYRTGFQLIHGAIDSLSQIADSKAQLDREKLQEDIKQIRRKIVELKTL